MFLTRFRVNTARREARLLLGSPRRMHGAVTMSFPDLPHHEGTGPRVLWRVDHNSPADTVLYLVSPVRPDLTHLVEQAGWPAADGPGWQTYDYGGFLADLADGDTWAFRLTANPVHSVRVKDGQPTKRTAHRTPRHQLGWLLKRQKDAGFAVLEKPAERRLLPEGDEHQVIVHGRHDHRFGKGEEKRGRDVTFTAVTYDGRLRVTDAAAFRATLTGGLGKAKAYGCGLMTLAPVR
ncbi:type I-E CRISPR-associated protein Cas6/Cse3/CasE [Streptomyces hainanensis]|uniref:Type I-E CRISPR-associated protein Cas6/Cse3/CasE n=1 Tax=Streptomyces hainanensis TaxID=402648 RepID=A0A4R4TFF2_9ACTN|nr:type I-E CRISPR-associated protein Cas6/Cse3/CasE [Streptomyces hainanensis]TDC73912.1 type I-E CRISPR-associated protein Cas6/Cse3/CasE [Streptomyces hainanensis]